jgi:propanediol utilization protein
MVRIPIGISNRHVHLSQIDADKLFWKGHVFEAMKDLTQPGERATKDTITIQWPKGEIEHVRVLMPVRKFTQVEVMIGDTFVLGIPPMIRISGNLKGTPWITLIWPAGEVNLAFGVIVAKRHLHCTVSDAKDLWLENGQNIKIKVWWERGLVFDNVEVRAEDRYALDCHIDIEEANAAGLGAGAWGEIVNG